MRTFEHLNRHLGSVPASVARNLGWVDQAAGQAMARRSQYADALDKLVQIARIQSTEASNAIEDIRAPHARIEALVTEKTTPENRSEEEIAGYRDVLDTIHASHADIPFKNSVLLQFHRDLYRYTNVRHAGEYKFGSNAVEEIHPDGTRMVRFEPLSPGDTRLAMPQLEDLYQRAVSADGHHRLLLLAAYVLDFLMIHPFQDGNGRMSRLITLLLLYHDGYEVGRYVSLEKLINDSRATYYEALAGSTDGWNESKHDIWPWTRYLLGILTASYKEFETRLETVGTKGSKTRAIKRFIRSSVSDTFTFDDIRQATPAVSDSQIRKVLEELKNTSPPSVEALSRGPGARWRRLRDDF
jgi:Fic family protein